MDSATADISGDSPNIKPKPNHRFLVIAVATVIIVSVFAALWMQFAPAKATVVYQPSNMVAAGFRTPVFQKLDPAYKDANDDLLADAPTDPGKRIDPPKLTFCFVASDDAETSKKNWQGFCDYLSKATGKPVDYLMVTSARDELTSMRDGRLQVAGFNTGSVPMAVNISGFIPICAIPSGDVGALTHTDIIVPADSPIQNPKDLKGRELTLTSPDSNSGYKAPLVLLHSTFGLQGVADFNLRYSFSHEASIAGIASHRYEAAAVASDMLGREIAAGVITPGQFRTIYESESFPTAALGYVYNLTPELTQKIHDAMLSYDWAGTPLEKVFGSTRQTKFVPVNYKNDWSLIRRIDEEMGSPDQ